MSEGTKTDLWKINGRENLRSLFSTTGQVSVVENNDLKFSGVSSVF
jgi:hypothetical protein